MKLSILIPTVPSRISSSFPKLVSELLKQIGNRNDIEVLSIFDNKKRTIGEKRQNLLNIANGKFLVFVDDDDWISADYISSIMNVLNNHPSSKIDCISFHNEFYNKKTNQKTLCKYDINYPKEVGKYTSNDKSTWRGNVNHIHVIRSDIAKSEKFKYLKSGEDTNWAHRVCRKLKQQHLVDKVLYYYNYDPSNSETQKNRKR